MTKKLIPRSLIPRSPLPNEVSARLPKCSAITKTGKRCRNAIVGRDALERMGLLDHEKSGEACAFHLISAKALSERGHQAHREKRAAAKQAAAEAAAAEDVEPDEQNPAAPGETIVALDADKDYSESESEAAPLLVQPSIYTVENFGGPWLGQLTPEQRKVVLRARLRGGS
jgi:hypothetical protein